MITISRDELPERSSDTRRATWLPRLGLYESVWTAIEPCRRSPSPGVVRHQQGQHRLAAELIGKAMALRPDVAVYHASLAEVHRALGQLENAVASGQ